ncbi:MAG TPA: ABC transporter permease subunit [Patescibacteria group bacterium]|nr:ABC transporter permease subunit [Patescibacteria group bacterium]
MTFLPIVGRELRVASRKRSTFWVRVVAALVALVIGSGFLILTHVGPFGIGPAALGKGLFGTLTWLSLAAALSAGLFFTSDCLSQEKREGTIGFLFLTDLRGYDVVLGKLLATSLRGLYALLAVFPILAITLLMGGVTGAHFWKTALALINALFFSLTTGLFVSAISRDSQKALAATLVLLVVLIAGGPVSDAIFSEVNQRSFTPVLSLSSPGFLFVSAGAWGNSPFWRGLLVNQAVAWLLLSLTCLLLPRTWQEKAAKTSTIRGNWEYWWKFGGAKRRTALRRKLIDVNPVFWLACRERWQAVSLWILTLLMAVGAAVLFTGTRQAMWAFLWGSISAALTLVLYLGIASQAGRFFVEGQRNGLIELLVATPLTVNQIVQGQWRALRRMFGAPVALCLAAQLVGAFLVQQKTWGRVAGAAPMGTTITNMTILSATNLTTVTTTTAAGTSTITVNPFTTPNDYVTLAISVAGTLTVIANLAALSWFGMWMGLNSKNSNLATLKTIVFVQIIPWFGVSFASAIVVPVIMFSSLMKGASTPTSQMMFWFPQIISGVATILFLIKDIAFSFWARRKLYSEFRERAVQAVAPIRAPRPPPLSPAASPPVIAPT